jgi:precorrin-2 dehydrogenase / sirohydrochlorin ferrochelatase
MPESSLPSTSPADRAYYPIFLDISCKPCLVVGGGKVAERKVRLLLKFGGLVKVVSPFVSSPLRALAAKGRIGIAEREYEEGDLDGVALVFAATNVETVNRNIREHAAKRNIPVNVVDNPTLCDFIVPSIVKKDPIVIAISTSGSLPYLSRKLRIDFAEKITNDYLRYAKLMGRFRRHLMGTVKGQKLRQTILKEISGKDIEEINRMGFEGLKERYINRGD